MVYDFDLYCNTYEYLLGSSLIVELADAFLVLLMDIYIFIIYL